MRCLGKKRTAVLGTATKERPRTEIESAAYIVLYGTVKTAARAFEYLSPINRI